jgi:hypothetical protein
VKSEVVWVFGPSAVGKKTLIMRTALGLDRTLADLAGMGPGVVTVPFVPYPTDVPEVRFMQLLAALRLHGTRDIAKDMCDHMYLVHGQWVDYDRRFGTLRELRARFPRAFGLCVYATADVEDHRKRLAERGLDPGIAERAAARTEGRVNALEKHFPRVVVIKIGQNPD